MTKDSITSIESVLTPEIECLNPDPKNFLEEDKRIIIQQTILATTNPYRTRVSSIRVNPGEALCFLKVTNNGWTDNKDVGIRPLEGFNFPDETEFMKPARRAQLFGYNWDDPKRYWWGYEPKYDRSRNGTYYWPNRDSFAWNIEWYMNDRDNGYGDNSGTANIDFLIFRL